MHDAFGTLWWAGFLGFVLAMLSLDLGVFHRKAHAVGFREAAGWSAVWVTLSMVFAAVLWGRFGPEPALQFVTAWVIEKSLSVDNLFVFVVVLAAFQVPPQSQHRVLFWGVIGALLLRAAMIFLGAALLQRFHWLIYVFGAVLVATGVKLFLNRAAEQHPETSWPVRLLRRVIPTSPTLHGQHFFARVDGRWLATPLFIALMAIEVTDVVFAVDSIPAVFAITTEPFLVFTSNVFAMLGLRSLFFLLAGLLERFTYLKHALSGVLVFVGAKMTLSSLVPIHAAVSLGVVTCLLGGGVAASWLWPSAGAAHKPRLAPPPLR